MPSRKEHLREVDPKAYYWANVFIAAGQVFLGIAAGNFFLGPFDEKRIIVVVCNIAIAIACWILGKLTLSFIAFQVIRGKHKGR